METEIHPIEPFLPADARLLICGTFPPTMNRWSMPFYYPNFINDMWRIFGIVYYGDKDYLVDVPGKTFKMAQIKKLLTEHHIAMSDTGREIHREKGNASDKYLQILTPIDLHDTLSRMPQCTSVATTGEKAASVIAEITGTQIPKPGEYVECDFAVTPSDTRHLRIWRMPSSSRAYPLKLDAKAEMYKKLLYSIQK